jgi:AAA family ATP:ADP antiporter
MVAVAQFWAFANDLYSNERGRRLFPIAGIGASLGAVFGSAITSVIFGNIGPYRLMLISAAGLLVPIALTIWVNHREHDGADEAKGSVANKPLAKGGGFQLVFRERYLLLIAFLVLTFNLVNTLGGFILNTMITIEANTRIASGVAGGLDERELIGTLAGSIQTWVNLLALLLQAFVVSRIFRLVGVRGALFVLPLVALGGYMTIALLPLFGIVRWTKVLENGTDYSIQNTTRHALFLPTSREAKYTAKQAIDSFFVRAGDMLQAVIVFAGTALSFGVRQYAIVNLVFVGIWLVLATAIAREHRKLVPVEVAEKAA